MRSLNDITSELFDIDPATFYSTRFSDSGKIFDPTAFPSLCKETMGFQKFEFLAEEMTRAPLTCPIVRSQSRLSPENIGKSVCGRKQTIAKALNRPTADVRSSVEKFQQKMCFKALNGELPGDLIDRYTFEGN